MRPLTGRARAHAVTSASHATPFAGDALVMVWRVELEAGLVSHVTEDFHAPELFTRRLRDPAEARSEKTRSVEAVMTALTGIVPNGIRQSTLDPGATARAAGEPHRWVGLEDRIW
jgi:hypothetical protein